MNKALTAFFILILAGCAGTGSRIIPPREEYSRATAVIFIPGYYGTALRDAHTGERRFLTFQQFFGDRFSLALYQNEMKTPDSSPLTVEGVIGSINAIPFVKDFDGYSEVIEFLRSDLNEETQVFPFAYDWRMDPHTHAAALDELVDKIRQGGAKKIYLVTHSLGGLIAAHYLRYGTADPQSVKENWYGAHKVDRVVFAGVPWRGTMSAFRNMQIGAPLYWNKFLLSQEAVSSFPAAYFLLPYPDSELMDRYGARVPKPLFDYWLWYKYDWGLLKDEDFLAAHYRHAREAFTRKWLKAAQLWLDQIHAPVRSTPPSRPILNIVGAGRPTLARAYWIEEDKKMLFRDWDIENYDRGLSVQETFSDGDETVTTKSAALPDVWRNSFPNEEIQATNAHGEIFNSGNVQDKIMEFLKE